MSSLSYRALLLATDALRSWNLRLIYKLQRLHDDGHYALNDKTRAIYDKIPCERSKNARTSVNRSILADLRRRIGSTRWPDAETVTNASQGVQLATFIDGTMNMRGDKDKGWSLEVAIPFTNFDGLSKPPVVGSVWSANINRWDGVEPDRRMSNWSNPVQPTPNPHVPERFGKLTFVQ